MSRSLPAYTEAERRTIATHESGHAVVAWLVGKSRKLEVLSIIKRKEALGLLPHSDLEERFLRSQTELEAQIKISLGGLVAEEMFFGEITSGPASDLKAATTSPRDDGRLTRHGRLAVLLRGDRGPRRQHRREARVVRRGSRVGRAAARAGTQRGTRQLQRNQHIVEGLRDELLVREELIGDDMTDALARAATNGRVNAKALLAASEVEEAVGLVEWQRLCRSGAC